MFFVNEKYNGDGFKNMTLTELPNSTTELPDYHVSIHLLIAP